MSDSVFIIERHTTIAEDVTLCKESCRDTLLPLVVFETAITICTYENFVLTTALLHMWLSYPGTIYHQDNARPHTA